MGLRNFIFIYMRVHKIDPKIGWGQGSKIFKKHRDRGSFILKFNYLFLIGK